MLPVLLLLLPCTPKVSCIRASCRPVPPRSRVDAASRFRALVFSCQFRAPRDPALNCFFAFHVLGFFVFSSLCRYCFSLDCLFSVHSLSFLFWSGLPDVFYPCHVSFSMAILARMTKTLPRKNQMRTRIQRLMKTLPQTLSQKRKKIEASPYALFLVVHYPWSPLG